MSTVMTYGYFTQRVYYTNWRRNKWRKVSRLDYLF